MMKADVAILGSGFGGSLCALIADRIGLRTVLIDRATHPRFAIGESSTPIADVILRDLADQYDLPRLKPLTTWGTWQRAYPDVLGGRKRGFSYFQHEAGLSFEPDPAHENELLVTASASDERSDTQWYRADVDAFFAGEVRRARIPFMEGVEAAPRHESGRWRLDGVDADFVIDATGGGGALARTLAFVSAPNRAPGQVSGASPPASDLTSPSRTACSLQTRTRALFSHFTGVPRWRDVVEARSAQVDDYPFDPDWSALHHVFEGGWMWMLRFDNDVVSAGLVLDESRHPLDVSVPPEDEWREYLSRYPSLDALFSDARLARLPGRMIRTSRLQRRAPQAVGTNWAMLPHTAGFVDPLHSTGIAHTMSGVERLMGILGEHWDRPERASALDTYQRAVLREIDFVDALVYPCYQSTHSFRLWTASTMLYFAAATSYEHRRVAGERPCFLLADDDRLFGLAEEASNRLQECAEEASNRPRASTEAAYYESWLEDALRPYNQVRLFRPRIPNMYEYTAARK